MLPNEGKQRPDDPFKNMTIEHVDDSIARALRGEAYFDPTVLDVLGFATATMRRMFSNLCHLKGLTYLEVGTYAGATFCAAFNNNPISAIGIDNFCQTWNPGRDIKAEFMANRDRFAPSSPFIEGDCFNPTILTSIGTGIDIFYFDGDHTREAQARALPHFINALADTFLFIVDDYNWPDVQSGTEDGLNAIADKVSVIRDWYLTGDVRQDDPVWHNGIALFLCQKI